MHKWIFLFFLLVLGGCKEDPPHYNGYIDADLTYLSSNTPGRLENLWVHRGQAVDKNQPLFQLEQTGEKYDISVSEFNQDNLQAQRKEILDQIQYNEINYKRTTRMQKNEVASQNELDVAKKDLDVLRNQLAAIDFQIKGNQATTADKKWQTERKAGAAPEAGLIFDTYYTPQEYVTAGQPVLSLITRSNIKIVFFVSERDLAKIHLNARIKTPSLDPQVMGTISYISNIAQYTPPIIYSREERHTLVFRVEARIDKPNLNEVHLGQPITLEVL